MTQDVYLGRKAPSRRVVEALDAAWSPPLTGAREGNQQPNRSHMDAGDASGGHNPRILVPLLRSFAVIGGFPCSAVTFVLSPRPVPWSDPDLCG